MGVIIFVPYSTLTLASLDDNLLDITWQLSLAITLGLAVSRDIYTQLSAPTTCRASVNK